jgi:hypothetical protein
MHPTNLKTNTTILEFCLLEHNAMKSTESDGVLEENRGGMFPQKQNASIASYLRWQNSSKLPLRTSNPAGSPWSAVGQMQWTHYMRMRTYFQQGVTWSGSMVYWESLPAICNHIHMHIIILWTESHSLPHTEHTTNKTIKLRGLSLRANYTDWATAACRQS